MGSLGVPEMLVIFLVALVLFGPKKLPELGRTIGKALTEFRRASNDLKATFDREMQTLERETKELNDTTHQIAGEIQSSVLDYSSFDTSGEAEPSSPPSHPGEPQPAHDPSTVGASAAPGAESNGITAQAAAEPHRAENSSAPAEVAQSTAAIEGTVPRTPDGAPDGAKHEAEVSQHS